MKKTLFLFSLFLANFCAISQVIKPIGINIAGLTDYSTELVFTDAFKQSRKWTPSDADGGGAWDSGINVPLNAKGYPLEIPYNDGVNPPQSIKALMLWDIGAAVPQGMYRLKVEGNGKVRLHFGALGTYNCPIDTFVNVTSQVMLEIISSVAANPISDIKFIYPEYINNYQNQTFTTQFTDFLADFQLIRFMDFTNTNGSKVVSWTDRTPYNYYSQVQSNGTSWQYVIQLANETDKNIWINIPHKADDNYIQELATLLQNNLNPNIKVYLEYSNEIWNGAFQQFDDCAAFAESLGYTGPTWERAWKYTAKRSADIFKIFEDVFTNDERLVKIIPSQAANSWLTNQIMSYFEDPIYNPNQVKASAVTIAPYFAGNTANDIVTNGLVDVITIPEIIQSLQNTLAETYQWMSDNKAVADNHGLELICYEGGQHLVATGNNVNNTKLTELLIATNHDPAMQDLYCQYFDYWYDSIGTMFCHFSSHGTYSKWGSWGVKEDFQDINNPKYLALQNCVFKDNTTNTMDNQTTDNTIAIYPNPASNFITIENKDTFSKDFEYNIYDILGRKLLQGTSVFGQKIIIDFVEKGYIIIEIKYGDKVNRRKIIKI